MGRVFEHSSSQNMFTHVYSFLVCSDKTWSTTPMNRSLPQQTYMFDTSRRRSRTYDHDHLDSSSKEITTLY
jgi:hypothetical protein